MSQGIDFKLLGISYQISKLFNFAGNILELTYVKDPMALVKLLMTQ